MNAPWKCPDCTTWIAGWVAEHQCAPTTLTTKTNPFPAPIRTGQPLPWPGSTTISTVTPGDPGTYTINVCSSQDEASIGRATARILATAPAR